MPLDFKFRPTVGDMISVIDMPPPDESTWWRGKRGFEVGFFPSECVEVIGDKVPREFKLSGSSTKPVFRKHGKLIAFFRSFLLSRPSRRKLKQSGILKERVFGCDLAEHLLNTGREIPLVLKCCTEFIEEHGVVDGIYRLSGVSSNIQRLRNAFDEDCATNLGDPTIAQDIHSVASLLKMYFRELPNPLLTYQLYDKFVSAVQSNEDARLLKIRDVVQQLPPPHYRTLQYLLCHLARVASCGEQTGMTPKNIAIVWAPNLLRSRDVENGGVGALHVVGVQAVLTEYLIRYCDLIFDEKMSAFPSLDQDDGVSLKARPKSLAISTPTKLLSLEEARARVLSTHLPLTQQKYIDVGGGPDKLPSKYHTVIDLPHGKQVGPKLKKSPSGWKSFFSRGWYSGSTRDKGRPSFRSSRKASTGSLPHTSTQLQEKVSSSSDDQYRRKKLRTVKSAESLVHCSKESSPVSTLFNKPVGSRHSSPVASMDSSFSYEVGSAVSKSPSLQKHTRSSSHESYFDNSMDIMSDTAVEEEEHSLFYYVNEQMQKMQECSSMAWQESHISNDDDEVHDERYETDVKSASECLTVVGHVEDSVDVEKVVRKQKLDVVDDFAQAKVQRLSWLEDESCNNVPYIKDQIVVSSEEPLSQRVDFSKEESYENETTVGNRSNTMSPDTSSFWLPRSDQSVFCKLSGTHEEGYKLDPFAFYDCSIDKLSSYMSSDNDTESSAKTVVERYGNAETVLVEVHATQDTSSDDEPHSLRVSQSSTVSECDNKLSAVSDSIQEVHIPNLQVEFSQPIPLLKSDVEAIHEHSDRDVEETVDNETESSTEDEDSSAELVKDSSPVPEEQVITNENVPVLDNIEMLQVDETKQVDVLPSRKDLHLNLSSCTNNEDADSMLADNHTYKMKTPPSPVYPPKCQRLPEAYSVQTKIENIPFSKKQQLLNIPSPSSPVEEVRKKFEIHASSLDKPKDISFTGARTVVSGKECPSKLSVKKKEMFESKPVQSSNKNIDFTKRKSDGIVLSVEKDNVPSKRHSEPATRFPMHSPTEKGLQRSLRSTAKPDDIQNKSVQSELAESQIGGGKKSATPSLFTQLKIRKLQSLKGDTSELPSRKVDPWSDPILDMQEEYYPVLSYPEFARVSDSSVVDSDIKDDSDAMDSSLLEPGSQSGDDVFMDASIAKVQPALELISETSIDRLSEAKSEEMDFCGKKEETVDAELYKSQSNSLEENTDAEKLYSSKTGETFESESVKRERINRIKEERRAQLREKLKTESFRLEAEEKEKVQSKFRLRKELCRYSLDASLEEKKVDKDTGCKSESKEFVTQQTLDENSPVKFCSCTESKSCKCDSEADSQCGLAEERKSSCESKDTPQQDKENISKTVLSSSTIKHSSVKKSISSPTETRPGTFRRSIPGDIKDRVALFERSKEVKEPYRLGPNGKFPQKQVTTSALTPSFVR